MWGGDGGTTTCLTDPRCVAEEHYRPLYGGEDLMADVPEEERGTIPLYRLISMDYVCQIRVPRISADVPVGRQAQECIEQRILLGHHRGWGMVVSRPGTGVDRNVCLSLPNCTSSDSPDHGRCLTSTPIYRIQLRNTVLWVK